MLIKSFWNIFLIKFSYSVPKMNPLIQNLLKLLEGMYKMELIGFFNNKFDQTSIIPKLNHSKLIKYVEYKKLRNWSKLLIIFFPPLFSSIFEWLFLFFINLISIINPIFMFNLFFLHQFWSFIAQFGMLHGNIFHTGHSGHPFLTAAHFLQSASIVQPSWAFRDQKGQNEEGR